MPTRTLGLGKRGSIDVPAVFNCVWELPDGRRATVLINPETQDHEVSLGDTGRRVTVPALGVLTVELR